MNKKASVFMGLALAFSGTVSSLANESYAVFDPADSTIRIPCVSVKGSEYEVVLQYGGPESLVVTSLTPLNTYMSGCSLFEPITNRVYIPVVTVGNEQYWAVISLTAVSPITLKVDEVGQYLRLDSNALSSQDVTCRAHLATLTTGGLGNAQYQSAYAGANAASDNAYCQAALAHAYTNGWGVDRDYRVAFDLAQASANQGSADGQAILGKLHFEGFVDGRKVGNAFIWDYLSADQGNAQGQAQFGSLHHAHGNVLWMESQVDEAQKWVQLSVDQGNLDGYVSKGYLQSDDAQAFPWFKQAADQGNVYGQTAVGEAYRAGKGVARNSGEAKTWFTRAADQGLPIGMKNLGYYYLREDQHQLAVEWFTKCHEAGDNLGECAAFVASIYYGSYGNSSGVAQDYAKALEWYRKTPAGYVNAARMYQDGVGVAQDPDSAVVWYRKAGESGDYTAYQQLAMMYDYGVYGTDFQTDPAQACNYYRLYKDGMWRFDTSFVDQSIDRVCQ